MRNHKPNPEQEKTELQQLLDGDITEDEYKRVITARIQQNRQRFVTEAARRQAAQYKIATANSSHNRAKPISTKLQPLHPARALIRAVFNRFLPQMRK